MKAHFDMLRETVSQLRKTDKLRFEADSRLCGNGVLFVALPGDRVDGRDFIEMALDAGSPLVLCQAAGLDSRWVKDERVMALEDPLEALHRLALEWRLAMSGKVIAFTGSNGKSTTKALCARLLAEAFRVTESEGNRNSTIGLPLSMLNCISGEEDFHILELGISQQAEMSRLCATSRPDIGCITNVQSAHLAGLDSLETVAREKGELFNWLAEHEGLAVVNEDDVHVRELTTRRRSGYSLSNCDVGAEVELEITGQDELARCCLRLNGEAVTLSVPGTAFLQCAVSAIAVGLAAGLPAQTLAFGLAQAEGTRGRMSLFQWKSWHVLDDSYNANPESTLVALETVAAMRLTGKRVICLGGMEELGQELESGHLRVAEALQELEPDLVLLKGEHPGFEFMRPQLDEAGIENRVLSSSQDLRYALADLETGVLLLKGSRSAALEQLLDGMELREVHAC